MRDFFPNVIAKVLFARWFPEVRFDLYQVDQQVRATGHGHFDRLGLHYDVYATGTYSVTRMPDTLSRAYHLDADLVCTNTEQLFESSVRSDKLNLSRKKQYLRHIKRHLVESEYFADLLLQEVGVDPSSIYLIGKPGLELNKRMLPLDSDQKSDYLFISDFPMADLTEEQYRRQNRLYGVPDTVDLRTLRIGARKTFLDWIRWAAETAPSKKIIVRVHPGESDELYHQRLDGLPNVVINNVGTIDRLIQGTRTCFCYTSSTPVEIVAAGKSVYALRLAELPDYFDIEIYNHYPWIDRAQFAAGIEAGGFTDNNAALKNAFRYYIYGLDPKENIIANYVLALNDCLERADSLRNRMTIGDRFTVHHADAMALAKDLVLKAHFGLNRAFGLSIPYVSDHLDAKTRGFFLEDRHFTDFETGYYFREFQETWGLVEKPVYSIVQDKKFKRIVYQG